MMVPAYVKEAIIFMKTTVPHAAMDAKHAQAVPLALLVGTQI